MRMVNAFHISIKLYLQLFPLLLIYSICISGSGLAHMPYPIWLSCYLRTGHNGCFKSWVQHCQRGILLFWMLRAMHSLYKNMKALPTHYVWYLVACKLIALDKPCCLCEAFRHLWRQELIKRHIERISLWRALCQLSISYSKEMAFTARLKGEKYTVNRSRLVHQI